MKDYDHPIPQITQLLGANSCLLRMTTFFFSLSQTHGEIWRTLEDGGTSNSSGSRTHR